MGIQRNQPIASQPSGLVRFWRALEGLFSHHPAAPADATVGQLLDQLKLSNSQAGAALDAQASAALRQISAGQAGTLPPAGWQTLARVWQTQPSARNALSAQLGAAGVAIAPSSDGRYLTFSVGDLWVTAEPASQRLRRSQAGTALCYQGNQLVETIKTEGNRAEVATAAGNQEWFTDSGQGYQNGLPIVPRQAPLVPGEPPRNPWSAPQPDELREPAWTPDTDATVYGRDYDDAIASVGGSVLQATVPNERAADLYNCHSFATTRGQGDLFDPFMRDGYPHWLNNPMAQLSEGPYAQLSPSQRVHPGDVIVYRNNGVVTHTGVVRQVDADGNPALVESKFGTLGLYQHPPFDIPSSYGAPAEIFRPEGA